MKKLSIFLLVVLIVLAAAATALYLSKDTLARMALTTGVRAMTGLELQIESIKVGVRNTRVGITGLKLYNPPQFTDRLMADVPEIFVDYDLASLLSKKIHLEEVRLDLQEFTVVKNEKGELNLDSLKTIQMKKGAAPPVEAKSKAKPPEMKIDLLKLKIGKVVYRDYSQGAPPRVREFKVNIDEQFENITDPNALVGIVTGRALMNTAISGVLNLDPGSLVGGSAATLKKATGKVLETGLDTGGLVTDTAAGAVKKTTETLKKLWPLKK